MNKNKSEKLLTFLTSKLGKDELAKLSLINNQNVQNTQKKKSYFGSVFKTEDSALILSLVNIIVYGFIIFHHLTFLLSERFKKDTIIQDHNFNQTEDKESE